MTLPSTPRQLNRMLATRLAVGAAVIGVLAGLVAWFVESGRVEQAALDNVSEAARHFESPAMAALSGEKPSLGHEAMDTLLARSNLVAIRVLLPSGQPVYENWGNLSNAVRQAVADSSSGKESRGHLSAGGDELLRVSLQLSGKSGPMGRLEGLYRIGEATRAAWRERVLGSALTAAVSALAAALLLYPLMLGLLRHATRLSSRLLDSNLSLLGALGNAVAKRDSDTDAHNYRVSLYAVALAEAVVLPRREIPHLVAGAFLHDVGKIGIPDRILLKPGKLTDEEFAVMKTHSLLGLDIVAGNAWMEQASCVIRHHHERFDGAGYPDGLAGRAIPAIARVFAVADVFDALASERPYKKALPPEDALAMIEDEAGSHFDPEMVAAFGKIALGLHREIAGADAPGLRARMRSVLSRYFGAGMEHPKGD